MSRIAKKPISLPVGVNVTINNRQIEAKGKKGTGYLTLHPSVQITQEQNELRVIPKSLAFEHRMFAGTMRALLNNLIVGVSQGFERKLQLIGVGYKAQSQGNILNLALGFSHPIEFKIPPGITIETPTQTDIVIKGIDKQLIGAVAARIRAYRPPEPYKGKGVRYVNEVINMKETKKSKK